MAAGTYALSLRGVHKHKPVKIVVSASGDHNVSDLVVQPVAEGGVPSAAGTWIAPQIGATTEGATGTTLSATPAGTEWYYIGTRAPGKYSVVLYQEGARGSQTEYDSATDTSASTISLISADFSTSISGLPDNRSIDVYVTISPNQVGGTISTTLSMPELSTVDVRGTIGEGDDRVCSATRGAGPTA